MDDTGAPPEPRLAGFRDIDEASDRIRALTLPLIPFEWVQQRAEVFARFGQAIALGQVLEAEMQVVVGLIEGHPPDAGEADIKPRTLGRLAAALQRRTATEERTAEYFYAELVRVVRERNYLAHDIFQTRLFSETRNQNVDELLTDDGRAKLLKRLGRAQGDFAYMAVVMADLASVLSANDAE